MRKGWCVRTLLVISFYLLSTSAGAHYVELSGELVEKNVFTVGIALAGKPFSYRQDGELKGFEIAIAQALADAHGLRLNTVQLPRGRLIDALQQGEVDTINTLPLPTVAPSLRQLPYLVTGDHVMIVRGNPFRIYVLTDLSGRIAAATSGTSAEVFGTEINDMLHREGLKPLDVHTFPEQRHTHFPVSMGHAAAYFIQTVSAIAISQDPESRTELAPGLFRPLRETGFAVRPASDNIHHAIEHAIAALVATGKYRRLLEQYRLPVELSPFR